MRDLACMGRTLAKALGVILATNASSFSTVALERYVGQRDAKQAAVANYLQDTQGVVGPLYHPGFVLGHRVFYNDNNFRETAQNALFPED